MTPIAPISTINDLFVRVAAAGNPRAVLWQDEFAHWQPISSDQIYQRVRALAEALLGWGAKKGDRVALIGENRWDYGPSWIRFENDKVVDWYSSPLQPLKHATKHAPPPEPRRDDRRPSS